MDLGSNLAHSLINHSFIQVVNDFFESLFRATHFRNMLAHSSGQNTLSLLSGIIYSRRPGADQLVTFRESLRLPKPHL